MKKQVKQVHHEKVAKHAESLLMATAHIADEKVAEARKKLNEVIESAKDAYEYVEDKAVETAHHADEYIREKPYQSIGIALGVGALIGYLIARRK
jgi:ElaB/YqjD/DUF883 family membrane-anchored ribosome-binding protein